VRFHRGIHLPEPDLWLDPWDAKPHAFVSHAHADHFARHERALCSDVTALLLRKRFRISENRLEAVSFHVPVMHNGYRLRLLPAGHISGSAMLHVTRIADNATLLYTGDFKTRRSRTAEAAGFLTADTLILESTFGLPGYEFPNPMEVDAEVLRFIDDCFSDDATPVLLAYSLGKAQEVLALLEEHAIPALLHPAAVAMTRACIEAGVRGLPEPAAFDGHAPPGHVVIAPPNSVRTNLLRGLKSKRTAMLSGWAMKPGAGFRYRVDTMIPFSDHADHPGLLECVQRVKPKRILTVHGYEREFAAELRALGMDAWSATGGDQLELPIQRPAKQRQQAPRGPWHKRVVCPLADFSDLCRLVAETGSRSAKTRFLAAYLGGLENDDDLRHAARWLSGKKPSLSRQQLSATQLRHSLSAIPGAKEERFREIHHGRRDIVRSTRLMLQELQLQPSFLDLTGTADFIRSFREMPPSMERIALLSERLTTLHPAEGETLVKLLIGDLRMALDPVLVRAAIATAFAADAADIEQAATLTSDMGETAMLVRHRKLHEARMLKQDDSSKKDAQVTGELPFP
jgi:DNA ligase 1